MRTAVKFLPVSMVSVLVAALLLTGLLLGPVLTGWAAPRKSSHDAAREKRAAERIQKQKTAERRDEVLADPGLHYYVAVKGRYKLNTTGDVELLKLKLGGNVSQVIDRQRILLSTYEIHDMSLDGNSYFSLIVSRGDGCVVVLPDTDGWVEGETFFGRVSEAGTYTYQTILGARRTIKEFRFEPGMTFSEYTTARAAGVVFSWPKHPETLDRVVEVKQHIRITGEK